MVMNRYTIWGFCLFFVAMILSGCVNHDEQDNNLAINAVAPQQLYVYSEAVESRTEIVDGKYVDWSEGDEIAYFPRINSPIEYRYSSTTDDGGYSLFQRVTNSVAQSTPLTYNYAVYPYSADLRVSSEGEILITLPEVQYYAENSFGVGAAPMVAVSKDSKDGVLQFKSTTGFLKLQLYGKDVAVKRIELIGNSGERLSGAAKISANYGYNPKITTLTTAVNRVVLDCGEGVKLSEESSEAIPFWLSLPEVTFTKGFTIIIYDADGDRYVKSTSNHYVIERNTVQPMKVFDVVNDTDIDIRDEEGKVRFNLLERSNGVRSIIGATEHNWKECTILVNDKAYEVELDSKNRPYVRVEYNVSGNYRAVLLPSESAKWYQTSPYKDIILPCSQFDSRAKAAIRSFPMYATYNADNGQNFVFDYGFALLRLRLKGVADVISVRAELTGRYDLSGSVAQVDDDGSYKVYEGMNFVALNCVNGGNFVTLNADLYRDFFLMIAPGDYSSGLRLSVCDTNRKAAFYKLSNVDVLAGEVYTYAAEYKPNEKLIFYEGFDNCVWGGDIVRGSKGNGFSPDDSVVGINTNLDRTGYEEALTKVPYNVAGSAFVQSNTWSEVSPNTVGSSHQATDSYTTSRYFDDTKYLFRVQEHPGYIAVGTGTSSRGIYRSPMFCNMKGIGSYKVKIRFAMQAGFNGRLVTEIFSGGRVTSAKLDGSNIELTADNYYYQSTIAFFFINASQLSVAANVADEKKWHTLELVVADVTNGSRFDLRDENVNAGVHGVYIDSIEVTQIEEWERKNTTLRVLLWNIQNGMWADQHNNYDNFVAWVKKYDPDVCIWCESETIYKDKTSTAASSKYLTKGWTELCKRYGHSYSAVGGNRDNYPQTVTSKYPITTIQRITDTNESGKPISHGAGHFTITVNGKKINIVSLHMWPQAYGYGVATADREASQANNEGDKYRAFEMQYIVDQTVNHPDYANEKYWILGGDTNAKSRCDNWFYGLEENSTKFLVHDVLLNYTSLKDIIGCRYPGSFMSSTHSDNRIDILYVSPEIYNMIDNAAMIMDEWLAEGKRSEYVTSFYNRSDHRPMIVDIDLSK